MEIEIITTKKKLSKSIINQMEFVGNDHKKFKHYKVLGYFRNIVKHVPECAIIKTDRYILVPLNYTKGSNSVYRRLKSTWTLTLDLKNTQDCDIWYAQYERIKGQCVDNQIYI